VYVAIAVVAAALALPLPLQPDSALDGSWRYLLAIAQERHLVFGRDVIFTYGPLGWISGRLDVPQHAIALRIALGGIAAAAGVATALVVSRARSPVRAAVAFVLVASAFAAARAPADLALEPAYELVFIAVALLVAATPRARWATLAYAGAGICAGVALGMKIVAFADIACAAFVALLLHAFVDRRGALGAAAVFGAALVLSAGLALRDTIAAGALGSYLALSAEITRGYAFAMALAGTPGEERATVAAVIAALVVAALCVRERRPRTAAIVGVIAVLAWKHATIREDIEHTAPLYATIAVLCGCAIAASRGRLVFGAASAIGVLSLVHLYTLYAAQHRAAGPPLAAARVPASLLPARGSIDALPVDVVTAAETPLRYAPLPMFQLAFAYTPPLDALDEAALQAHGADTILFRFAPVDGRYVPAEAPATFRGLLCRYAFAGAVTAADGRRFSRLERQPHDTCRAVRSFDAVDDGGTIRLPPLGRGEFAVARIAFDLTARGRWASAVGRVDLPQLTLISGDGRTLRRSVVPETAGDGIVVAPGPADAAELESLFRGLSGPAVTALRVEPGSAYRVRRVGLTVFRREISEGEGGRVRAQRGLQRIVSLLGEVAGA
jgi:hypothetical protein